MQVYSTWIIQEGIDHFQKSNLFLIIVFQDEDLGTVIEEGLEALEKNLGMAMEEGLEALEEITPPTDESIPFTELPTFDVAQGENETGNW